MQPLCYYGASPVTRAWRDWRIRNWEEEGDWGQGDAVLAAVERNHVCVLNGLLQCVWYEPVKEPWQDEATYRMRSAALSMARDLCHYEAVEELLLVGGADFHMRWAGPRWREGPTPYESDAEGRDVCDDLLATAKYISLKLMLAVWQNRLGLVREMLEHKDSDDLESMTAALDDIDQRHEQEEPAGEVAPPPAPPEPMPSGGLKRRPPGFLARLAVNVKHDQAHGGHTPLSLAVLLKNVEMARLLLEYGAQVNLQDSEGRTALHWAAMHGQKAMVQLLLEYGASNDIITTTQESTLPIMAAVSAGHVDVVDMLLRHQGPYRQSGGTDPEYRAMRALGKACQGESEPMVELLLTHCIEQGYTCHLEYALMWAAEAGNVVTVRRMLELGPHDQGKLDGGLGMTWDAEVIRLLLDAGADHVRIYRPPDYVRHRREPEAVAILREAADERSRLVDRAEAGDVAGVAELLGIDLPSDGQTPPRLKEEEEWVRVRRRLRNGRRIESPCRTPLMAAAAQGQVEAMRLLHLSGADLDAQDNHGMTALCLAVENGRVEAVELLMSWGAKAVFVETHRYRSKPLAPDLLSLAVISGHSDVITRLTQLGLSHGLWAALKQAAERRHVACIEALLRRAPLDSIPDRLWHGRDSPVWTACVNEHVEVLLELLAWGAPVPREERFGYSGLPGSLVDFLEYECSTVECLVLLERCMAERAMVLCKARCIHDASLPSSRRPACLQDRAAAEPLPSVSISPPSESAASTNKRRRRRSGTTRQEETAAVASWLVQEVKLDVFEELVDLLARSKLPPDATAQA